MNYKEKEIIEEDEKILVHFNFNEPRKKIVWLKTKKHRQDTIAWMVISFSFLFFGFFSMIRFTIIGQFIDDYVFSFLFGWYKFFAYFTIFIINILWIRAKRVRMNFKFLLMIVSLILLIFLFTHNILLFSYLANNKNGINYWSKDIFSLTVNTFLKNLNDNSVIKWMGQKNSSWFMSSHGYVYWDMGAGIIGSVLSGTFAYLDLILSLILSVVLIFFVIVWILTGSFLYLALPISKRQAKSIRLLPMKSKDDPNPNPDWAFKTAITVNRKIEDKDEILSLDDKFEEEMLKTSKTNDEISPEIFTEEKKSAPIIKKIDLPNQNIYNTPQSIDFPKEVEIKTENQYIVKNEKIINSKSSNWEELEIFGSKESLDDDTFIFDYDKETNSESLDDFGSFFEKSEIKSLEPPLESTKEVTIIKEETLRPKTIEEIIPTLKDIEIKEVSDDDFFGDLYDETRQTIIAKPKKFEIIKGYKLPSVNTLTKIEKDNEHEIRNKDMAQQKAKAINNTFQSFNVNAKVINIIVGPSVTKFEIQPGEGTKVNSIISLENDLKLSLASQTIRIEAPIQGKNLVGIEIANSTPTMVSMREIFEKIPKDKANDKLLFVLGKNVLGQPLYTELNKMPHLLVAGSTGSGKSVMINAMICSILLRAKPDEVRFLMVDPKKVELSIYSEVPHMLSPVISDMKKAARALKIIVDEMEKRYELFTIVNAKNIQSYNEKMTKKADKLPFIVVIIDELADLMLTGDRKSVEESIMRITQMARAAGIHLVLATQRPSVDVITGTIKSNIPCRIAFAVTTGTDSRTILDSVGAENLIGRGDMLYTPPGSSELLRSQGAYLSDSEIEAIVAACQSQQKAVYSDEFTTSLERIATNNYSDSKDDLYDEIKQYVIINQAASVSTFKRKFKISYDRAMNIMDALEADEVVGPSQGTKPREVLIKNK